MVLGKIFGGDTVKAVGNVIDDMHFSGEEKEKLKLQFAEVEAKLKEKQMAINLADSQSTAGGISGSLGANADLIRSLTAVGITGSFTSLSSNTVFLNL